jgi:hypothetical protein
MFVQRRPLASFAHAVAPINAEGFEEAPLVSLRPRPGRDIGEAAMGTAMKRAKCTLAAGLP